MRFLIILIQNHTFILIDNFLLEFRTQRLFVEALVFIGQLFVTKSWRRMESIQTLFAVGSRESVTQLFHNWQ